MNPVIRVAGLEYHYGRQEKNLPSPPKVLEGIDLRVEKAELLAIIGATGSGKTTLLQILAGLLLPQKGEARVLGLDLGNPKIGEKELDVHRRRTVIALQRPEEMLFRTYVGDDVAYGPANYGIRGRALALRVKEAMETMGLSYTRFKDRRTDSLSGGEMRKAALAGVLALKPEILLLDEPAAGLDPPSAGDLFRRIRDLRAGGVTVIFSTHDMDQVMLADRAAVFHEGRLLAVESPEQLFFHSDIPEKAGLLPPESARICRSLMDRGMNLQGNSAFAQDPEALAEIIAGGLA
ncbi:ATP-binding cassette domain-containing protein [Marispirochaeta aestuarii]|uniref:ATP-binding cassette domain-containing protein n=1 Tax=Marispirochaeta aestuarii TaxID=1963862 RepID=UPI0029C68DFB|nr:ATP-binding cassette domain-containing protein [Marispirochaeta aestuarii]